MEKRENARGLELVSREVEVSKDSKRGVSREKTEKHVLFFKKGPKGTRRSVDDNDEKVDWRRNCNYMEFKG